MSIDGGNGEDALGNDADTEVRRVQPYQATKRYVCPGCTQDIPAGAGHVVVVPRDAPEGRRHWHRACWERRATRRPRG